VVSSFWDFAIAHPLIGGALCVFVAGCVTVVAVLTLVAIEGIHNNRLRARLIREGKATMKGES
jgi:hypothetical protein